MTIPKPKAGNTDTRTFSQRASDAVTWFCGTWTFVFLFAIFTILWVVWNTWLVSTHRFDQYPYIFLNLIFTVVELFQGPLIMMSQNREQERDRELWRGLHSKLDEIKDFLGMNK